MNWHIALMQDNPAFQLTLKRLQPSQMRRKTIKLWSFAKPVWPSLNYPIQSQPKSSNLAFPPIRWLNRLSQKYFLLTQEHFGS